MQVFPAIYKCPNCSNFVAGHTYLSGNTIGAVRYSDAYLKAPMGIPPWANYIGCPKCGFVFEKGGNQIKSGLSLIEGEEFKKTNKGMPLLEMLKSLLQDSRYQDDKKMRRTFALWYLWGFNHRLDESQRKQEKETGDYKRYTDELLEHLKEESDIPDSRLLRAEILRERGDFREAREILEFEFPPRLQKIIEEEKLRISRRETKVFPIASLRR